MQGPSQHFVSAANVMLTLQGLDGSLINLYANAKIAIYFPPQFHTISVQIFVLRMSRPLRMLTLKEGILLAISHRMILCTVILNGIFGLLIFSGETLPFQRVFGHSKETNTCPWSELSNSEIGFLYTTGVLRHQGSQKKIKKGQRNF